MFYVRPRIQMINTVLDILDIRNCGITLPFDFVIFSIQKIDTFNFNACFILFSSEIMKQNIH